jgi:Glycosyltransferase family 87
MLLSMAIVTSGDKLATPADKRRRLLEAALRRPAAWYAGFAVYAACVAAFSGPGLDHWWGIWAAGGYALAAVIAAARRGRGGQVAALAVAVAGALVAPLTWLATQEPSTPDATVVARSGVLLLHHGSPYLPLAQLTHGGWLGYNPYLPVMAVFGLPKALGLPGILGDPRPWLAAATFLLLYATFRITSKARAAQLRAGSGQGAAITLAALAIASPVMAFPLAMGITDPPVIALICLTLAMLTRGSHGARRLWQAALVLGVVCAMKYTAWPALAVLVVMVKARDGGRAAVRFGAVALGTAAVLTAALAPAALPHPDDLLRNTVAYPLGLTGVTSPAQSPLPGHLLTTLGPAGHATAIALLILAGVALVLSLVFAAPAGPARAATRTALGLTALFALSPTTRFGYFCYPLALCGWVVLSGAGRLTVRRPASRLTLRPRQAPRPLPVPCSRRPADDSGS